MPSQPQPSEQAESSADKPPVESKANPAEVEIEEVRIAMALNGGVSLAVWMGGCAVELDRARRANRAGSGAWRIYDALCECFGRRLVFDILTGASAGGINGALLSAAMVNERPLTPKFVRERWLDLGDLSRLLHDTTDEEPAALMDGDMFHDELLRTFEKILEPMPATADAEAEGPTIPSLDVTMTDVIGVERRFMDTWGNELLALEHRPRFKFREKAHFTAEALANAARTSASFPVAFEPWPVEGNARVLAGLPRPTYGIDGGLLDNAPIRAALDLIPTKPASSRVLRYVCYLNGDPPQQMPETIDGKAPTLREVGGYTINLPRSAPFVDQLYAIQRAVERPPLAKEVQRQLLCLGADELSSVADALLGTYRERRTMQSLEELLAEPGDATAMNALLKGTEGFLPWIPHNLNRPEKDDWRWGIRPAQRILHLLFDLLRPAIPKASEDARAQLLERRMEIDAALASLGAARDHVTRAENVNDPSRFEEEAPIDRLQKAVEKATARAPEVHAAVETALDAFFEALRGNQDCFRESLKEPGDESDRAGPSLAQALFGVEALGQTLTDAMRSSFFRRVLSIEVVRRAFSDEADIESAEELRFVQLTPASPSPIFTKGPLSLSSPASAAAKLTGIGLGHFAGFYRRSWRANDFMWGRLDAASRIVDLLLDRPSPEVGRGADANSARRVEERSAFLAEALLGGDQDWLLEEALADAASVEDEGGDLSARVTAKIKAELSASEAGGGLGRMPFTRAVFQRAAQLEIVGEELPHIRSESANDRKLGSAAKPLELGGGEDGGVKAEIEAVREIYKEGGSLPERLTDPEEIVSDLGLRTITHAAFVGLSAIRAAKIPLSNFFGVVRTPLLAIAGTVAASRLQRATVIFGFWAAAIFLTSRLVTAEGVDPSFSDAWSLATLAALVAALGVLGTAAVPGLRAIRGVDSLPNGALALALVGSAAGVAGLLAWTAGGLDNIERLLFAPDASSPPEWVLIVALFALGVFSTARLPLPGWLGQIAGKLRRGPVLYPLLIATFVFFGAFAAVDLVEAADKGTWQAVSVLLALAGAPTVTAVGVAIWKDRRPPTAPNPEG